ncbi:hypothetical protein JW930_07365 [Candidatus Woesearchaeota archaeon]|nr:hypothetical protein [Candidatus Woesearchaeota archaeon]
MLISRESLEIRRKLFHILFGIAIASSLLVLAKEQVLLILILFLIFGIASSILVYFRIRLPLLSFFLNKFDRAEHLNNFPGKGAFYYVTGCFFTILLFPVKIAVASILTLAFGDSIASLVGKYYGRTKHPLNPKKILEGTIAGIAAATLSVVLFVPFAKALFATSVAMIVEALELKYFNIDDNLSIPLVTGAILLLLS